MYEAQTLWMLEAGTMVGASTHGKALNGKVFSLGLRASRTSGREEGE